MANEEVHSGAVAVSGEWVIVSWCSECQRKCAVCAVAISEEAHAVQFLFPHQCSNGEWGNAH